MARQYINWRYNIGDNITDNNRNFTIIEIGIYKYRYFDKKKNKEYIINYQRYKYHCNICGFEGWILLSNLNKGAKCSCCSGRSVLKGVNDLATLRPDLLQYICDVNNAYTHTVYSQKKIKCKCPICGFEKYISINNLSQHGFVCNKCSDGISYPEKFIMSMLDQLDINYIHQLSKMDFDWCDKYKYDFYLCDYNAILETHGEQHYTNTFFQKNLMDVKENDLRKKNIAIKNGIVDYIELNCSESTLDYIKTSIYNNDFLKHNFKLDSVNWELCHKESLKNKLTEVCKYWNEHFDTICVTEMAELFSISRNTILKYLHIGNDIGLCYYDKSLEYKKSGKKRTGENNPMFGKKVSEEKRIELLKYAIENGNKKAKKICQYSIDTLELISVYPSINNLKKKFGYSTYSISECCKGHRQSAYGYKWNYYHDNPEKYQTPIFDLGGSIISTGY